MQSEAERGDGAVTSLGQTRDSALDPTSASKPRIDIVALVSNDLVTDQRMQRTLISLEQAGYRCMLVGRQRPHSAPLDLTLPFAQFRHRLRYDSGKLFYVELMLAHYCFLLRQRPRLILAVDLDTVGCAAQAAQSLKIPYVFDAHELFEEMPEVARRPWIKRLWGWWGRKWVPGAAGAYTVGQEIAKILTERYGLPFGVVRNFPFWQPAQSLPKGKPTTLKIPGPDSAVEPSTSPSPFTVLYQGALNEGRGLEELIAAVAALPQVRAWIAGEGPEALRLRAFAKTFPMADVHFFGELGPAELRELTPRADLGYALMRDVSLNYRLSLSNKTIDYVHAGLPSLQMDWPEYRTLQNTYGCFELVDELTIANVVAAISRCQNFEHLKKLQEHCLRAAPVLTWQGEASYVLALVRGLLGTSAPNDLAV